MDYNEWALSMSDPPEVTPGSEEDLIRRERAKTTNDAHGHLARVQKRNQHHADWVGVDPVDQEPFGFSVGNYVYKIEGYEYVGVVVSAFRNKAGQPRYVVENLDSEGMLHIFNGKQLREI